MENKQLTPFYKTIVGVQFLFVAFGATVLVPLLVGLDPSTALFTAGVGTLVFHLVTKGIVPIFLGSSFAFIAPIVKATELYGLAGTLSGMVAVGFVYIVMSALVKWQGVKLIKRLFPPVVIGPVIMLIGLSLAGTGVDMAKEDWLLAIIALTTAIVVSLFAKGLLKLIPIFAGIIVGYIAAVILGRVDMSPITEAAWFGLPHFEKPEFSWGAILFMIPVAIAPVIEHVGDVYAVSQVAGKDFVKKPGLHRTMLGDGIACMIAGSIGGPPVTTYSEVTGAMVLTKVTDPVVIRIAAITGIVFSMIGKISAILKTIPGSVLGGIMLLLFGTIAATGINNMVSNKTDMGNTRNLIIVSLILTTGIGGAVLQIGEISMTGIGLSALIGVLLNLIIPQDKVEERSKE
ncbi:MAG TPA: uracil permease [Fermentimonas caenicola]|jgi:uracil permease|uniref:uracil-xanthine permease family protein n=1 Tax=Lascolabacillus TaxID=1924067 RepID=UPI0006B3BC1F|nr:MULTISPECIES: solute carrier family 23 protein [Lascolabacillus]MBP7103806.1 uracil permease [Fermentimonas sp.]MDI9625616.1 solute carrier family 23 protein [Bacteroidota bacterium]TAH62311.1 MAG: uracil permease [Fermentimonas caenicola]MCK9500367.1 NCS2 family nucleobase:cation symporter [Lascolabacillus sp.]MDD3658027.1 solute carrier family 23 protein [Lascolabacillus sp.]